MKKCVWSIKIYSIILPCLFFPVAFCVGPTCGGKIISYVEQSPMIGAICNTKGRIRWKELSQCINHGNMLTTSQSDKIKRFWLTGSEVVKNIAHYEPLKYKELMSDMNELLLSEKRFWEEKMRNMLSRIKLQEPCRNTFKQIALFQILSQFLTSQEVPLDVLQVIQVQLVRMLEIGNPPPSMATERWQEELERAMKINAAKYLEGMTQLSHEKDFQDFVIKQRRLGKYGIRLAGNWSPKDQKLLFEFWISESLRYYTLIHDKPQLQLVLETQIVQTKLIETVKALEAAIITEQLPGISIFKSWAHSTLQEQSSAVVNYIRSLQARDIGDFVSMQHSVRPYGLQMFQNTSSMDQIKVIHFWSRYFEIFLMIKSLEEITPLQLVIEDLVLRDFNEVSIIMGKFLEQVGALSCKGKVPALVQFLKFYLKTSSSDVNKRIAKKALSQFSNPLQKYKKKLLKITSLP